MSLPRYSRRVLLLTIVVGAVAICTIATAQAQDNPQPKAEIFGGYSLARTGISESGLNTLGNTIGLTNVATSDLEKIGFETSATFNFSQYLGIETDVRWNQGTVLSGTLPSTGKLNANLRNIAFLSGPRAAFRRSPRIVPFAHVLIGGNVTRVSATGGVSGSGVGVSASMSDTGYAIVAGGGLDVNVNGVLAIRVGQVDYVRTHSFGTDMNNMGVSFGVNLRLGGK
jgi:opacity protein-like surface antigen